MDIQYNRVKNDIDQSNVNSITTNLFVVLVNLRDAGVIGHNEQSITSDLLDITIDTHGIEFAKELSQICEQNSENDLFDMLVELHGIKMTKEFIYTRGKMKGLNFGKHLGKCDDPCSAIKNFNVHIQSNYDIKIDGKMDEKTPGNKEQISSKNGSTKNLRNNKKTASLNPLQINTQGFIEGALSFMTGMQANICINNPNENKIYFKQPKKHFFGLF